MKSLAIIMAFCLIFAIMPQNKVYSYNNVLYVGGHGEGNYSSIQAAINAAPPGYTIFVYPGVYKENLYINKSISLIGENRETTIIDGCHKGFVVRINASNVTIKNFTIRNSGYSYASIYITSNGNCIVGNKIEFGNGISLYKSNNNVIEKNVFSTLNGKLSMHCNFYEIFKQQYNKWK
ncbi:MAG: right-handed parallel beta-helix repeat-containing protein [Thermoplasmata archaeon]|nr:right-handed parallel beta-helix repeat-containing protein [Thermoplasmata archaeon]